MSNCRLNAHLGPPALPNLLHADAGTANICTHREIGL
jgi:hypothetical protein